MSRTHEDSRPRTPKMLELDRRIEAVLTEMLRTNEDITARGVVRHVTGLGAASSITRDPARRKLVEDFRVRQDAIRRHQKGLEKEVRGHAAELLARKDREIALLKHQVDILAASHRALMKATGERGVIAGWQRTFEGYKTIVDELRELGAIPTADIRHLPSAPPGRGKE